MKKFSKSLLFLCTAMVFSVLMVATVAATGKPETVKGEKVTMAPGPWGKYTPAIDITTVAVPVDPKWYPDGEDDANNAWIRAYNDAFGINAKVLWASDQYEIKVNLMIASGELADFFKVTDVQFKQLVEADLIQPLDAAYKYASSDTLNVLEKEAGPTPKKAATVGGKLMAIPWVLMREAGPILWVRTDWLEKLGFEEPKSMADVLDLARAYTKNDPDANGKDDTIGLLLTKGLYDTWGKGFFNAYRAYPQMWLKDGNTGKLVYGSIQPQMKEALSVLQQLYGEGVLDKEWAVKESSKAVESVAAGKCGLHYGEFHSVRQAARDNDPSCEFKPLPVPSADARPAKVQLGNLIYGYWVVRKGYEYPEAMIKMLNMWMEYFYFTKDDQIYEAYNKGPKGAGMWQASLVKAYRGYKNVANAEAVRDLISDTKPLSDVTPEQKGVYKKVMDFLENGNEKEWRYTRIFGPGASMFVVDHYRKNGLNVENEFYTSPTPTMTQKWSTLEDKAIETFTKIIMGDPISDFDKFVQTWNNLGGNKITDEVNQWYATK